MNTRSRRGPIVGALVGLAALCFWVLGSLSAPAQAQTDCTTTTTAGATTTTDNGSNGSNGSGNGSNGSRAVQGQSASGQAVAFVAAAPAQTDDCGGELPSRTGGNFGVPLTVAGGLTVVALAARRLTAARV